LMKKFLFFYLFGEILFIVYFTLGFNEILNGTYPFATDLLALCFLTGYFLYVWTFVRKDLELRKRYRRSLIISLLAPFIIGPIFKYFLLVPMPKEGLIVAILDYFWYLEFL
jgi:cytochrome c oxidase assembly factor CtaG